VILIGGSYGGMLAAWHRFKYPHLSVGAIASGAPVDFYIGEGVQKRFLDAYTHTFEKYGGEKGCGEALTKGLNRLPTASHEELAAAGVRPCGGFDSESVDQYGFYAKGALSSLAMIDYPYPCGFIAPLPANPVKNACRLINSEGSLKNLHDAVLTYVNATGNLDCVDLKAELVGKKDSFRPNNSPVVGGSDLGVTAWNYQACTELLLEPITSDGYGFYPEDRSQVRQVESNCAARFGVRPRPFWMPLAFGIGSDYSTHMSNIIFMENEKDPWHVGTVSIPPVGGFNSTVVRMLTEGGAHHQDLRFSSEYDSDGVKKARLFERETVQAWLAHL